MQRSAREPFLLHLNPASRTGNFNIERVVDNNFIMRQYRFNLNLSDKFELHVDDDDHDEAQLT